jgi:hypothetical protein
MKTPLNSIAIARVGVEQLLADSKTFRASVGAANADQAKQRIHYTEIRSFDEAAMPARTERPCVLLVTDTFAYDQIGQSAGIDLGASGGVAAVCLKNSLAGSDDKAITLDYENWLGGILDDIRELLAQPNDYFPFRQIQLIEGPFRADLTERASDDYWAAVLLFSHNVNP